MKKGPVHTGPFLIFRGIYFFRYLPIEIGILNVTFYPITPSTL